MPCRKGTKQTPQAIVELILKEHAEGVSVRELAKKHQKPFKTIKNMVTRENNKKRKLAIGIKLNKRGRPAKDCIVTEADKVADLRYKLNRKESRIKQLEMENELLRDFLKEIGRG